MGSTGRSRRMGATILVATAVSLGVASVSASAQSTSPASPSHEVVFTYGTTKDVDSFDPFAADSPAGASLALQYNLLVDFSPRDLSPVPGIASEVPTTDNGGISPDGLTWTFTIRTGMRWSDGEPLTAHDVAFTYNYILDNSFACCVSYLRYVDSISAPDDGTVVIHTTQPTAGMLSIYDYIIPEHVWKEMGADRAGTFENFDPANGTPVTSGPFHLVAWDRGRSWTLAANPDYWSGPPQIDEIVFKVYPDDAAMIAALRSGEVDLADSIPVDLYESLQGAPNITTHASIASQFVSIGINTGSNAPAGTIPESDADTSLRNPALRRALAMAVDKQALVNQVALGGATVGSTIVPPTSAAFHLDPPDVIPFDIAGANELLDGAGYVDTNHDGTRNDPRTGNELNFRLFTRSERADTQTSAALIGDWWRRIGVGVKQHALTDRELTRVIYTGNYDLFIWGWPTDPDPDFILSVLTCGQRPPRGIWNDTFYCNEGYDADYLRQKTLLNVDERVALVKQMQQQAYDSVPYIVLYYDNKLQAYRSDRWAGFVQQPARNGDLLAAYGPFSFLSIHPIVPEGSGEHLVPIGIAVAALVAAGMALLVRRRRTGHERA